MMNVLEFQYISIICILIFLILVYLATKTIPSHNLFSNQNFPIIRSAIEYFHVFLIVSFHLSLSLPKGIFPI